MSVGENVERSRPCEESWIQSHSVAAQSAQIVLLGPVAQREARCIITPNMPSEPYCAACGSINDSSPQ